MNIYARISYIASLAVVFACCTALEQAAAWVRGYQPFSEGGFQGEVTVVLHRFCRSHDCGPLTDQEWQDLIQTALSEWNGAGSNFVFRTRPVRSTDDPCNLPGEVAVILADPGQLCPGDGPLKNGDFTGRTEYGPRWARVSIKADSGAPPIAHQFIISTLLLHEFGHVTGLGHPDEAGQSVAAVMNSSSAYDHLQPDDIAGMLALYGERQEDSGTPPPSDSLTGFLENPSPNSFQSGIGVISGWVCDAEMVEIDITTARGEVTQQVAAYGTERLDTAGGCGDTNNGFGLLFNWNLLGDGEHEIVALVDGIELGRASVTVVTLGEEFLRGAAGEYVLEGFPGPNNSVVVEWSESQQNFVIRNFVTTFRP